MPMPDMSYTQSPAGYNLATGPAPAFSSPGLDTSGLGSMFQELARRKAEAAAEDKRRWDIENARAQQQMSFQQQSYADAQKLAQQQAMEAKLAAAEAKQPDIPEYYQEASPSGAMVWRKRSAATGGRGVGVYDARVGGGQAAHSAAGESKASGGGGGATGDAAFEAFRQRTRQI